jgi:hypothetical protein
MASGIAFVNVNDKTPIGGMINAFLGGAGGDYFIEAQKFMSNKFYDDYKQLKNSLLQFQSGEQRTILISPDAKKIMGMTDSEMNKAANEKANEIIYNQIGKYKTKEEAQWWIYGGQN